jgi:undecaprenyl pyrophosphate synthase
MQSLKTLISSVPNWSLIALASALGIAAASFLAFESENTRKKRTELKRLKELRLLAVRISTYGQTVHQRFPTGDVVVNERDLAEELRKRPEAVVTALNLLLTEQKVQRAPLRGYWKLNS